MTGATHSTLMFNQQAKHPLHRLPFVKLQRRNGTGAHFWAVPARGGYFGGYEVGEAMAHAYLKYLLTHKHQPSVTIGIARDLFERLYDAGYREYLSKPRPEWPEELNSLHGQMCGFFNTLDGFLHRGLCLSQHYLNTVSEADIISKANAALLKTDSHFLPSPPRASKRKT